MVRRLIAALILSASAPAAAQLRVGINVEGAPLRSGVPAGGMENRREFSPNTLPSMPLSLSPAIPAESVAPDPSAVVVQTPLSSPSKADEIRAQAAKTVADWRASRSAASAAKSAFPSVENHAPNAASIQLDALFDGSLPAAREVLSRAHTLGLNDSALATEISASRSPSEAAARLSALGVLGSKEADLAVPNEDDFRFLLTRLWRKTAPSIPSAFKVDETLGVPALKVERDGTTYFVHAVTHGQLVAPRRASILNLVRTISKAGHALYSEQNIPAHYGYKTGLETLDRASTGGARAPVVAAAPGYTAATLLLKRVIDWAVAPRSALAALAWVIVAPASPMAWALLAALGAFALHVLAGGLPMSRWKHRRSADENRAWGREDMADQFDDEAANFFVAKPDLENLRGLELPQPLGATTDPLSVRSRAIADAVAADATVSGASDVHVIVGSMHAHEVAWRLANGPRTAAVGTQIS